MFAKSPYQKFWIPFGFLLPAIALVGVLVIGLGYILEASLHELDLATYRLKEAYTLSNYLEFFEPTNLKVLWRTFLGAVLVTFFTLILAFPYAYVLVRCRSAMMRKFLLITLFLPFFIGQVVRAYGWLIILGQEGILNQILNVLGVESLTLIYNYPAVIFGLIQYMLPFAVLLLIPAMTAISEDLEWASESLGASWGETLFQVIIPLAKPGIVGACVVVFTLTLTDFAMPEILGGGQNDFIASSVYDSFFQLSNAGLGSAISMILVTIGSLLVVILFRIFGTHSTLLGERT